MHSQPVAGLLIGGLAVSLLTPVPTKQTRTAQPVTLTARARRACARWSGCGVARRMRVGGGWQRGRAEGCGHSCVQHFHAALARLYSVLSSCCSPTRLLPPPPAATRAEYASLKAQLQSETFPPAAQGDPPRLWTDLQPEEKGKLLKERLKKYCQKVGEGGVWVWQAGSALRCSLHMRGAGTGFVERCCMLPGTCLASPARCRHPVASAPRLCNPAGAHARSPPCPHMQVYKRVLDKPTSEQRVAGICQRENSFYVDTVRAFRWGAGLVVLVV